MRGSRNRSTVLLKAWTSEERFSHHGKYWRFNDIVVEPPSAQKPHPQVWMGAGSERSIRNVAERGFNLLLGQYASPDDVAQSIAWFRAAVEASGRRYDPMQVGVTRAFFVTDSAAERDAALDRRLQNRLRQLKLATTPGRHGAWRTGSRHRRSAGGQPQQRDLRQPGRDRPQAARRCSGSASATC